MEGYKFDPGESVLFESEVEGWDTISQTWVHIACASGYPKITIYDPSETEMESDQSMTVVATGWYNYRYRVPTDGASGWWRAEAASQREIAGGTDYDISELWFRVK